MALYKYVYYYYYYYYLLLQVRVYSCKRGFARSQHSIHFHRCCTGNRTCLIFQPCGHANRSNICKMSSTLTYFVSSMLFATVDARGVGTGGAGSAAAPTTFGAASSAPSKVCRCDRLSVMIIYRWKSPAFVCYPRESFREGLFLLCTKLTKLVYFYDVTRHVLVSLLLS